MFVACLLHRQKTSEKAGVENYIFMSFALFCMLGMSIV